MICDLSNPRFKVLLLLEKSGWGNVPQPKIPPHVIAAAERGEMPEPRRNFAALCPICSDPSKNAEGLCEYHYWRTSYLGRKNRLGAA